VVFFEISGVFIEICGVFIEICGVSSSISKRIVTRIYIIINTIDSDVTPTVLSYSLNSVVNQHRHGYSYINCRGVCVPTFYTVMAVSMKVTVCFDTVRVVVPCGGGEMLVSELTELAAARFRKATGKVCTSLVLLISMNM